MNENILIVEDEKKIVQILQDYLHKAGYSTTWLENGSQVVSYVKKTPPDLILLDLMLPAMNGEEICKQIRGFSDLPIIMLTAKAEEIDMLLGLEFGADDYIKKPFSPREVTARVKTLLRRSMGAASSKKLVIGILELDEDTRQVKVGEQEIPCTPIEFTLLHTFLLQPDRVFSRSQLLDKAQGYEFEGYERTVDSHVKNLRKKISTVLSGVDAIKAVYGIGYKLNKEALTP